MPRLIQKLNCRLFFYLFISISILFSCKNFETTKIRTEREADLKDITTTENKSLDKLLQRIKESISICNDCTYDFSLKKLEYLFSVFNKDLSTNNFSDLILNDAISFSLCNKKRDLGYLDCFYLFELKVENDLDEVFESFDKIPNNTIHYKPPQNWSWYKKNNKIFFLYSKFYDLDSKEFKNIDSIIRK